MGASLEVTVAIPTYKTRDSIFNLLDSLDSQSYRNFSIMVVYKPLGRYRQILGRAKLTYQSDNTKMIRIHCS